MTARRTVADPQPARIQRKRTKGWKMPEGAVYVGRPSPWGNPFLLSDDGATWRAIALGYKADLPGRRAASVALFRLWLTGEAPAVQLAEDEGGVLVFNNGAEVTMAEQARGIASVAAGMYPVEMPDRPDLASLRGRDLACWCPPDEPCHADVLLEIANAGWLRA